jgi:alkaline phosphatase D
MNRNMDRRTFVRSALAASAGALLTPTAAWTATQKASIATEGSFAQGIAAGEPATNAITLWTRLAGVTASANVGYEVARDPGFAKVLASGTAAADAGADFTVHQRLSGSFLQPGEQYYYRAVHDQRTEDSGVFTLRQFRVDAGQPVVIDEGGPLPA